MQKSVDTASFFVNVNRIKFTQKVYAKFMQSLKKLCGVNSNSKSAPKKTTPAKSAAEKIFSSQKVHLQV